MYDSKVFFTFSLLSFLLWGFFFLFWFFTCVQFYLWFFCLCCIFIWTIFLLRYRFVRSNRLFFRLPFYTDCLGFSLLLYLYIFRVFRGWLYLFLWICIIRWYFCWFWGIWRFSYGWFAWILVIFIIFITNLFAAIWFFLELLLIDSSAFNILWLRLWHAIFSHHPWLNLAAFNRLNFIIDNICYLIDILILSSALRV